ncbi:hypothetical protein F511_00826 [Dorcoceras hygrometricum]|nr:hypothetical protein F511_00826 [Dorcoceras hygrometricum]
MFAAVTKCERSGPVFRFFMDLGDAVSYVKQLNIPSGVVGACRLDIAYEHFKEKPDLFQFIPNERQVKEANKLLKTLPSGDGKKKVVGVPVFSAQNLDIAIATNNGIKWYTPYFFDKTMLDNILEESVDQHFHALIQTRNLQRRRDIGDDNLSAEAIEEMGESNFEHLEVQEVLDEMGHSGIPLSVISKAAEIQLLSAASIWRAKEPCNLISDSKFGDDPQLPSPITSSNGNPSQGHILRDFQFPFGDWLSHPWLKQHQNQQSILNPRDVNSTKKDKGKSPFLPKITMVGVSTGGEPGKVNKATLRKTMDDLTKELERVEQEMNQSSSVSDEDIFDMRDPLFVANVGDYYPGPSRTGAVRWVRGGSD